MMSAAAHTLRPHRNLWRCTCSPRRLLTQVQAEMHAFDMSGRMEPKAGTR